MSDVRMPALAPLIVAQLRHQVALLVRTPRALTTGIALPVLLLLVSGTDRGDLDPARLAGYAVLGLTMTAWTTHGIGLIAAREAGVLKRWRAAPLPAWCYFAANAAATTAVAVLAAAVTVLAGVVQFGTDLDARRAGAVLVASTLGAIACAAAATALTGFVPSVASAFPVLGLTYLPVVLFSGGFGPRTNQPQWTVELARYLPVRPAVEAVEQALRSGGLPGRDLLVLAAWAVGGGLVSLRTFRWAPTTPRQRRPARTARTTLAK
ncbi:MAG TPA: ABC transporter permease [Jatrophihabitantaceae bacterium]